MRKLLRLVCLVAVLGAGSLSVANAQKLETGTWTGTVVDPGGQSYDVTFVVQTAGDSLKIDMTGGPEGATFPFLDIRFDNGKLMFQWEPGSPVNCTLEPVATGGFSGPCTDDDGESGLLTMVPPKKEG